MVSKVKKVILDTDIGIDDAIALILALKSEELAIEAITTVSGNVHVKKCTRNALKILELMRREDIPVAEGAARPLKRKLQKAEYVHGQDGLGDSKFSKPNIKAINKKASDLIIEKIQKNPKNITLGLLGPLTNIAVAIRKDQSIIEGIKEIVLMGGAYGITSYGYGNISPVAEFNIYSDPEAARIVFSSNIKIVAIGLDITMKPETMFKLNDYLYLKKSKERAAKIVSKIIKKRIKKQGFMAVHDAMVIAHLVDPNFFQSKKFGVDIETRGELTLGQTVTDRRGNSQRGRVKNIIPNIYVCTNVKEKNFLNFLVGRLTKNIEK
jgi:inosine-uridine nucleoside N-ribohydrolase